ncbi:response regulator transcription factor [Goodfellowiella coeruleoviolacea]|uniref:DNA-binding response regulator, NarL/FixJ family, contains REC and HTH domains n=1 Tax=Goodfellowiella coeruleoviolacea TaxID=334858 RepID=A0AAE3KIB5_9PSEU|nr:response regulator transcription factor [Goodfellowiella coeruleoviolacea]MCP2169101.1 DNA-binding response regulator, NarL/FixJ family, contains REC and HTH domains [Goodfellowiella coeruleoviolacea]
MRVVIAEDLLLLREGLVRVLTDTGHTVVAAVDNAVELERAVEHHEPDLSIVDVRLPPGFRDEGLRAALAIRQRRPSTPILILSQYVERTYAAELLADGQGAVGYLLKDRVTALDEFLDALDRVAAGGTAMDPEVVRQLFARNNRDRGITALTPREREVLSLVAQGLSNSAICAELVLAPPSVEKHITNIFTKLDLPPADDTHRRVRAVLAYLNH